MQMVFVIFWSFDFYWFEYDLSTVKKLYKNNAIITQIVLFFSCFDWQ